MVKIESVKTQVTHIIDLIIIVHVQYVNILRPNVLFLKEYRFTSFHNISVKSFNLNIMIMVNRSDGRLNLALPWQTIPFGNVK